MDTTRVIADPLVRNLATVAGNLPHADPANDHPATMLALRASVVLRGPKGERVIPIDGHLSVGTLDGLAAVAVALDGAGRGRPVRRQAAPQVFDAVHTRD